MGGAEGGRFFNEVHAQVIIPEHVLCSLVSPACPWLRDLASLSFGKGREVFPDTAFSTCEREYSYQWNKVQTPEDGL